MEMGSKRLITFTVSDSGSRIFDLTSGDLEVMGYKVRMLSSCIFMLEMDGRSTPIVCDAPYMQPGTQDRPVVYDSFNGHCYTVTLSGTSIANELAQRFLPT